MIPPTPDAIPPSPIPAGPGNTILVAENDVHHRQVLQRVFRAAGITPDLRFVTDGNDLLDYLNRRGRHGGDQAGPWPAVVLLDLHMPGVGGIEVLQRIRADEAIRSLPIVILSSSDQRHHIDKAYLSGANAYLVKLGDFDKLVTQMQRFAVFWLDTTQRPQPQPDPARPDPAQPGP